MKKYVFRPYVPLSMVMQSLIFVALSSKRAELSLMTLKAFRYLQSIAFF